MLVIGTLLLVMAISSALVVSACMLSSLRNLEFDNSDRLTTKTTIPWSRTTCGGMYITKMPPLSFEPEDLEDVQVVQHF